MSRKKNRLTDIGYRKSDTCRQSIVLCVVVFMLGSSLHAMQVRIGAEILLEKYLDSLAGKRVGVVCNHTSVLPNGIHLVDTLLARGVKITALYAPEHGIRGSAPAGQKVFDETDRKTGIHIYSLYGGTRKPAQNTLENIDVILFDLQDVGARFYTYGSTMAYVMEAAAENGKKCIVLDRPNPINGIDVEGPVLDLQLISFVGLFPIPVRHGLTLGELAMMIVGEGYINPSNVDLFVVPMEGWKRSMWYDQTGLRWIPPSPNMKTLATATVYPGTCLFESSNITEGRGTKKPFEYIGAPGLQTGNLIKQLTALKLPGVKFTSIEFTPRGDSIAAPNPKFMGKQCRGVYVQVTNRKTFKPVLTGLMLMATLHDLYPRKFEVKQGLFDHLIGDTQVSEHLLHGKVDTNILGIFNTQIKQYLTLRSKYLMYN